jgi:hypothetical protein
MIVVAWIFAFIFPPVVPLLLPFKTGSARFFFFFARYSFYVYGMVARYDLFWLRDCSVAK